MSKTENFKNIFEELRVFLRNLNKDSAERKNCLRVINKKISRVDEIESELTGLRVEFNCEKNDPELIKKVKVYVESSEDLIKNIRSILENRLKETPVNNSTPDNMATNFDLKTASSMLPSMDGTEDTTKQLIDAIELYDTLLNETGKPLLTNYVLKVKLSQSAKIRLNSSYPSNVELIRDMKNHLLTKKSVSALSLDLHNSKQKNRSIEEFGKSVEELMLNLTLAEADDNGNALLFANNNEKIAINTFANGLNDGNIRTIIKARNFSKLKDAIVTAKEEEISNIHNKHQVFSARGFSQRFSRGFRNNTTRNSGNNNNNTKKHWHAQRNNFNGRNYGNRGNFRNRGTPQSRGNNTFHRNNSCYHMNTFADTTTSTNTDRKADQNASQSSNERFFRS